MAFLFSYWMDSKPSALLGFFIVGIFHGLVFLLDGQ